MGGLASLDQDQVKKEEIKLRKVKPQLTGQESQEPDCAAIRLLCQRLCSLQASSRRQMVLVKTQRTRNTAKHKFPVAEIRPHIKIQISLSLFGNSENLPTEAHVPTWPGPVSGAGATSLELDAAPLSASLTPCWTLSHG